MNVISAGFVERLLYASLAANLRAGKMTTIHNGAVIGEDKARRLVARAQRNGWLPTVISIVRGGERGPSLTE
jgi:hypothetical protein